MQSFVQVEVRGATSSEMIAANGKAGMRAARMVAKELGQFWIKEWPRIAPSVIDRPTPRTLSGAWASGMSARVGEGMKPLGEVIPGRIKSSGMDGYYMRTGFSSARGRLRSGGLGRSVSGWLSDIERSGAILEIVPLWGDPDIVKRDQYGNIPNTSGNPLYSEMIGVLSAAAAGLIRGGSPTSAAAPPGFNSIGEWAEKRFGAAGVTRRNFRIAYGRVGGPLLAFFQPGRKIKEVQGRGRRAKKSNADGSRQGRGRLRAFAGYQLRRQAPKKFGLAENIERYIQSHASARIAFWHRHFTQATARSLVDRKMLPTNGAQITQGSQYALLDGPDGRDLFDGVGVDWGSKQVGLRWS